MPTQRKLYTTKRHNTSQWLVPCCQVSACSFHFSQFYLLLLTFAQRSKTREEHFTVLFPRHCVQLNSLFLHVHISLHFSVWHPWVVRKKERERRRGREVCDVFVWEMAGGSRFTVAGLAEGRKKRLFKRLPTDSCSPIEPTLSATSSHRHAPCARRET